MKKTYMKPAAEVVEIDLKQNNMVLRTSEVLPMNDDSDDPDDYVNESGVW